MASKYEFLYKQDYKLGFIQENIEMIVYSVVCFFLPLLIGHPQIIVGVMVNAVLIMSALNLKSYKLLPIIILPSLGVLSRGIIFGPFTVFLLYMIPFIWIGNSILVYSFKRFNLHNRLNKWVTLVIGAFLKTLFLFGIAFSLVKLGVLPVIFLTAMGIMQFYTAILGGIVAFSMHGIKKRLS